MRGVPSGLLGIRPEANTLRAWENGTALRGPAWARTTPYSCSVNSGSSSVIMSAAFGTFQQVIERLPSFSSPSVLSVLSSVAILLSKVDWYGHSDLHFVS